MEPNNDLPQNQQSEPNNSHNGNSNLNFNTNFNNTPMQNGNPYPPYIMPNYPPVAPANNCALAAMVMGIIAIITTFLCTVYLPLVFGSLAIILALLSKGDLNKMHQKAKIGIIVAICAFVLDIVIVVASFTFVFSNDTYKQQFYNMYEQIYGESFQDALNDATNGTYNGDIF